MWRILLISLLAASFTGAATVHVATTGNDANPGTPEKPFATLKAAAAAVWAETEPSEIIIHQGSYPGDVQVGSYPDREGGPRARLVIRAAQKPDGAFEDVIFEGARRVLEAEPVPAHPGVFKAAGAFSYHYRPDMWESDTRTRYMLAADLATVARTPGSFWITPTEFYCHTTDGGKPADHEVYLTKCRGGITLWRTDTTVRGLQFRGYHAWNWSAGVEMRGSRDTAEDCRVSNAVRGYQIMMDPVDTRVVRCRAEDVAGGFYSGALGAVVEDCVFVKTRDRFMVPAYPQDDCGIQYYSPAAGGEVRRNLCVGFANGIFMKCLVSKFVVENNTCVEGIEHGIGCTGWHPESVFRYNIVSGFSQPILMAAGIPAGAVVDYNCLWAAPAPGNLRESLEKPKAVGTGTHTIYADPRFATITSGDYHLLPDSPCARIGPEGQFAGAFPVVGPDFRDTEPPQVKLSVEAPARQAGGVGRLYFEPDPWIGGGRNVVKSLEPANAAEWVAPQRQVVLRIEAVDAVSAPTKMRLKLGEAQWSEIQPFSQTQKTTLPAAAERQTVAVRVSDQADNWSEPVAVSIRLLLNAPALASPVRTYANRHGMVLSISPDAPCIAEAAFGTTTQYGKVLRQPLETTHLWSSGDGGDWIEMREQPRSPSTLALLPPQVEPGSTIHYRLTLTNEVNKQAVTEDAVVTLDGEGKTWHVAPTGRNADGEGSRGNPWRTLQFAVDRALPGDRIMLLPGLYVEPCIMTHGGVEGAPITIEAAQPGTVTLDGRRRIKNCLELNKSPYVIIRGLEVRWFGNAGIYVVDSPQVSVMGCKIWNNFWMGWPVGSGVFVHRSPGFTADHNLMYEFEQGINLLQSPQARLTHNTILANMYGAVHYTFSAAGTVARNNSFAFNGNDQYTIYVQHEDELKTFDSDYNNLGCYIRESAPTRPPPQEDIVPAVGSFFRNTQSKAVISHNGTRYYSLGEWRQVSGQEQHSIFKDPLYVDPETWDFRLHPNSPNIAAGEQGATLGALGVRN